MTEALDSLSFNLAVERQEHRITLRLIESQQGTLSETIENFALAAAGFGVCRMTEPR